MKYITRIWKGYKEYCEKPYFVGQKLILTGRLANTYKNITKEYKTLNKVKNEFKKLNER